MECIGMSKQSPPVFLNLLHIRFPVMAIVSIAHRVSGTFLALVLPWIIWVWAKITLLNDHDDLQNHLSAPVGHVLVILTSLALYYHFLAGVRHLIMDLGFFETKKPGRISAWLVWIFFLLGAGAFLLEVCVW
jgi:succinate dehydrogenase / fumarate reductase cytochrome b subunit